jgi:hypothetical protein
MKNINWRSSDDYVRAEKAEPADLAWECLRRNSAFRSAQRGASVGLHAAAELRARWGLSFRA